MENEHLVENIQNVKIYKLSPDAYNSVRRKWKFLIILILAAILYLLYWFEYVPFLDEDLFSTPPPNDTPIILYWTAIFSVQFHEKIKNSPIDQTDCAYKCFFTDNRKHTAKAKLIIFHARDLNETDIPVKARKDQWNVFYNMESPYHTGIAYKKVPKNFFDLTMTYRLDSDVLANYGRMDAIDNDTTKEEIWNWDEVQAKAQAKSKPVLQLVSNCHTPSRREAYVERLRRYIEVTSLGICAQKACNQACEQREIDKHLFYLAFENSVCKDYVTEKLWRLKNLIVPIVLDRNIYKDILPADSFIATNDFNSPNDLAKYLTMLAANRTEYLKYENFSFTRSDPKVDQGCQETYKSVSLDLSSDLLINQYFNWTQKFKKQNFHRSVSNYCDLCTIAHTRKGASIPDIVDWWDKQGGCQSNFGMHHLGT